MIRNMMSGKARAGLLAALLACSLSANCIAADVNKHHTFRISAQALDTALLAFSNQTKVQVLMWASAGPQLQSSGVTGELTAVAALKTLLKDTGLAYRLIDAETVAIVDPKAAPMSASQDNLLHLTKIESTAATDDGHDAARSADPTEDDKVTEVVVLGKPTVNVDVKRSINDALPFQVITREDIQRAGFKTTTEMVQNFTANTQDLNIEGGTSGGNNQAGKAEINLRGLGVSNTLVLVNGRRLASGMPFSPQGDVSTVPLAAIDRVEMLSSGASAIYGSSAVGGVINLILRKEYQGTELDFTYGNTVGNGDAANRKLSFVSGWNSPAKHHNLTFYGTVGRQNRMTAGDLGLAERARDRILEVRPSLIFNSAIPPVSSRGNIHASSGTLGIPGNPAANFAGVPAGYDGSGGIAAFNAMAGVYNLDTNFGSAGGDELSLIDNAESASVGLNTYHRFTPAFNAFSELAYGYRRQFGERTRSTFLNVPGTNAFNPFGQRVFVSTITTDLGPPDFETTVDDLRAVAGLEGRLSPSWRYVADLTYQKNELAGSYKNVAAGYFLLSPNILNSSDPAIAYNPFLDFSSGARNSQAAIDMMNTNQNSRYHHYLKQAAARLFGGVDVLGRALKTVGGVEYRKEGYSDATVDYTSVATGETLRVSEATRGDKDRDVLSAYVEVQVPLLPVDVRQKLNLDVAARMEDFSDFGSTFNPIVALLYQPTEGFFMRASWGTGFVAPPLYLIDYNNIDSQPTEVYDPKRGGEAGGEVVIIADPKLGLPLDAETSESISYGLVLQPRALPGLRLSVDWFSIKKEDNLLIQLPQAIVDNEDGLPAGLVVRGPVDPNDGYEVGPILTAFYGWLNATRSKVEAIDVGLNYLVDTALGELSLSGNGTFTTDYSVQVALGAPNTDYLNRPLQSNGAPVKFRGLFGVNLQHGPFGAGVNLRHVGSYRARPGLEDLQGSAMVDSANEVGLQLSYEVSSAPGKWLSGVRLALNIANLLDETPVYVAELESAANGGYSQFGPLRGRNFSISLRKNFSN